MDVVLMRRNGVKVPRGELRAAQPVRGDLQLTANRPGHYAGQRDAPLLAGLVAPGTTSWALRPLDGARVTKILGLNLIIVGTEEVAITSKRVEKYRQAWWCRLVPDVGGTTAGTGRNVVAAPEALDVV